MQELVKVVVDAMGGDNAPQETVKGAVDAVNTRKDIKVILTGRQELVEGELSKYTYPKDRIEVVNTTEVIEMAEPPVNAIRKKKDSSIVVGMNLVKKGEADAFVSAGSTGAVLVGGQVIVGRIKGVERPPLAPLIPTKDGVALLIDCGANVDARPSHLVQFAKMGSIYMENVVGVKNPRVGIVNIGAEEEKGNALVKETFPLLKECKDINFIGSVEARDIPAGVCDVVVCEAFVGNVILKLYEGVGATLISKGRYDAESLEQNRGTSRETRSEGNPEVFRCQPVRRRASSWTEGACGENSRKFQSCGDHQFHYSVCAVQTTEHQ